MKLSAAYGPGRLKIKGCFTIQGPQKEGEHGLSTEVVAMFKDPKVQQIAIVRANTESENSSVYARFADDPAYIEQKHKEEMLLTEEMVTSWFVSAGFKKPEKMYCLVNKYDFEREDFWWLVKTEKGFIEIGWRKRVISIDWSDTDVRTIVTEDDVTKSESMVHAWSVIKAIEYLTKLNSFFRIN